MKRSRLRFWGLTAAIVSAVGCGSSGGEKAGTGGVGGAATAGAGGGPGGAAAPGMLLVDFDGSDNNADPTDATATPSPSDTLFASLLQAEGISHDTFVVPSAAPVDTPAAATLTGYSALVWYTADMDGKDATLSAAQEAAVQAWLDQGHKTMLVFSEQLLQALGKDDWATETDAFLANDIGAAGDAVDNLADVTYDAKGAAGTPFANQVFHVMGDVPLASTADEVNPRSGTDTLVTVMDDPEGSGSAQAVAAAVGRKHVGAAGSSTVVYVGMPIENIQMTVGNSSAAQFFHAALVYAGLKSP